MKKDGSASKKDPLVIWMLIGIPVLFIAAAPLHFVFEWTGDNFVAGLFTPVNESPWEHLKLTFWPILVWCIIGYVLFLRRKDAGFAQFAMTCAVTEFVCTIFMISFFYTYTGALGQESLVIDIISLFISLLISSVLAVHVYKHTKPGMFSGFISAVIILMMAAAFIYFTFDAPHLPIFMDPPTGAYGI